MAALKEARSYGLSCGRVSDGSRVSVFHVKLTDSALKAFESYRASQDSVSLRPSIRFQGSQGHICIPQPDCPAAVRTFSFYLSHIGRDSPQGSFDCIQQYVSSHGGVHLDCLGSIQDKVTVCATDDSYQKARQSMAQAEEETRSRSAIVIKPGGRYLGKKVQFRKPAPGATDAVPSRKRATPINLASAIRKSGGGGVSGVGGVAQRPFRDRVLHLLALRPYRKAELLLRLQKDGLAQADKDALDGLLQQVANVSAKDGTCTLRDCMYQDVQKDWPGYSEGDQQLLKRVLLRKLCQPHGASGLPGDSAASSPPREPGSSASPPQKRPQPPDFIDPLASKKPRISHFTQRAQPAVNGKPSAPDGREALLPTPGPPAGADTLSSSAHLPPRLQPPRAHDPLADVSNALGHGARDCGRGEMAAPAPPPPGLPLPTDCAQPGSPARSKSRRKSKKHKEQERAPEERPHAQPPEPVPAAPGRAERNLQQRQRTRAHVHVRDARLPAEVRGHLVLGAAAALQERLQRRVQRVPRPARAHRAHHAALHAARRAAPAALAGLRGVRDHPRADPAGIPQDQKDQHQLRRREAALRVPAQQAGAHQAAHRGLRPAPAAGLALAARCLF